MKLIKYFVLLISWAFLYLYIRIPTLLVEFIYKYISLKYSLRSIVLSFLLNQIYIQFLSFVVLLALIIINFIFIKSIVILRCCFVLFACLLIWMSLDTTLNSSDKDDNYYLNLMFFYANIFNICNFLIWLFLQQFINTSSTLLQFAFNHRFFVSFALFVFIFFMLNYEKTPLWSNLFDMLDDFATIQPKQLDRYSERCIKVLRNRMWLNRNKHIMDLLLNVGCFCLVISFAAKKLLI